MQFGGLNRQYRASLNGLKARVLRSEAPTQQHLYTTEWRSTDVVQTRDVATLVIGEALAGCGRLPSCASRYALAAQVGADTQVVIAAAAAAQCSSVQGLPLLALEVALALVQSQATATSEAWMLVVGHPAHQGTWGLGRSAREEASLPLVSISAPIMMALTLGPSHTEPEVVVMYFALPNTPDT